jgi:hypothetical protein
MYLGLPSDPIFTYRDISQYTTADNAVIYADEQDRPSIVPDAYNRAKYEEEPVMAERVVLVDKNGRKYDLNNPLPTNATFTGSLTVNLSGVGPTGDTVGIVGENGNRLVITNAGELTVNDPALQTILSSIFTILDSGSVDVNDANTQSVLVSVIGLLSDIYTFQSTMTQSVSDSSTHTKLDSLISSLSTINGNLLDIESAVISGSQAIVDEVQQANTDINSGLQSVVSEIQQANNDINDNIDEMDANLGSKLDTIEATLSNLDADTLWTKLSKSVDRSRVSSYSDVVVSGRTLKRLDYVEYSAASVSISQKIRVSYTWLDFGTKDERVGPIVRSVLPI